MKNLFLKFFVVLVLVQSCNKDENPSCENCNFTCLDMNETDVISNTCIDNWDCNFKVTPQSKVDVNNPLGVSGGDENVFQMINETDGVLEIADDEFTNILVFELDESQDSFSVEDGELEDMQVHYKSICFCPDVVFKEVISGCLQGEKQSDGTWFIQGNLNLPSSFGNVEIKFDAQFMN